ncbi:MAG: CAP domain-containing protein [Anaerolineae bacterium]|nr:CAP domain-containing protein [Anaerolineae bacterium]
MSQKTRERKSEKAERRSGERTARWAGWAALAVAIALVMPVPSAAQGDPRGQLFALLNQLRLREGFAPLGNSTLLNAAAQRHADDLVTIGQATHTGSDGSTYQQRIREARYSAWDDGLVVGEVLWTGLGGAEDAVTWFRSNPEWAALTDPRYREAGIGYVDDSGVRYFVVTLGARPGVLPIFINDGADTAESPAVALRLTNEDAVPLGDGAQIGRAIEVRLSNSPTFDGVPWQPWEELLPWLLAGEEPGEYGVYVEFRDGANRTAIAEDIIQLVAPGNSPPTPTPFLNLLEATPEPGTDALDLTPTAPDAGNSTATPPTGGATSAAPTRTPVALTGEDGEPIVFATWTPLPTDTPDIVEAGAADWPLLLAILLQGAAIVLGIAVFLRRRVP